MARAGQGADSTSGARGGGPVAGLPAPHPTQPRGAGGPAALLRRRARGGGRAAGRAGGGAEEAGGGAPGAAPHALTANLPMMELRAVQK